MYVVLVLAFLQRLPEAFLLSAKFLQGPFSLSLPEIVSSRRFARQQRSRPPVKRERAVYHRRMKGDFWQKGRFVGICIRIY